MSDPAPPAAAYAEACRYLYSLSPLGVQLGTERLAAVLRRLGDPQHQVPALHIAGTNGKGSTAAFTAALLLRAARALPAGPRPRVGLYTSPHLLRLTERIQISTGDGDLAEVDPGAFAAAIARVREGARAAAVDLTFFEVITAAAFLLFAEARVAVAVLETGLGGRLDATRLCAPRATAITSISADHQELLGETLPQIAAEKAGIFRPAVPAYAACDDPAALQVLRAAARAVGAPLCTYPDPPLAPLPPQLARAVSLCGVHQLRNATLAVCISRHAPAPLGPLLAGASDDLLAEGLAAARWPGRLERLERLPDGTELVLDAAHNPEGADALARWLADEQPGRPRTVVLGVVAGKQAAQMLAPLTGAQQVVLCRPPTPRGRPPEELLPLCRRWLDQTAPAPIAVAASVAEALELARRRTPAAGLLLVYGSIFLLAAVRRLVLGEPADEVALQDPLPTGTARA